MPVTTVAVNEDSAVPFLVAHRAGNDLLRLRRAEALGIPLIEADVHLWRGRLEVRHLKTAGPLPVLWDRWMLAPPWTPRLLLHRLLAAAAPTTQLMLDLKGRDIALARQVARALAEEGGARPVTVCARDWRLLTPFGDRPPVRLVHSVGNARQLQRLLREETFDGVSIHRRLLDAGVVRELKARAGVVMSWPVKTPQEALGLAAWGVDGLITESFERLAQALPSPRIARAAA